MVQRSRLLDAVLDDLYGERRSPTSGVLPHNYFSGIRVIPRGVRHPQSRPPSAVHARLRREPRRRRAGSA